LEKKKTVAYVIRPYVDVQWLLHGGLDLA